MDDVQKRIDNANARRAELSKRAEEARALAAAARGAAKAEAELAEAEDELFEPAKTAQCEWALAALWFILAPAHFTLSAIFVIITGSSAAGGAGEATLLASLVVLFLLPFVGYCASSCILVRCCCAARADVKRLVRALSIYNLASSLIQLAIFAAFSRLKFDRTGFCALPLALCHALGAASFIAQLNLKRLLRCCLSRPAGGSPGEGASLLRSG